MTQARTYPTGVPCWIDVHTPDPDGAARFYGELMGWTLTDAAPPGGGSYLIATLDGQDVAAIVASENSPAVWNTYVATADADRTAERVGAAGGEVMSPPADAGDAGRWAIVRDPTGVAFRLWQPGRRRGAQLTNAPGAWNFSDLHTDQPDTALAFYADVFGWEVDLLDFGEGPPARMVRQPGYGDHLAATVDPGIHDRQDGISAPPGFADAIAWVAALEPGEAPHWHVTFAVEDRDLTLERAAHLGATVVGAPRDTAWTRDATLRDPAGAVFTVSQFTPPQG